MTRQRDSKGDITSKEGFFGGGADQGNQAAFDVMQKSIFYVVRLI
jgi:hypothetical protein